MPSPAPSDPDRAGTNAAGARLLLASIHDVGPKFDREVSQLAELFERRLGRARFAMLVVPDHWGEAPLSEAPWFKRKLRDWADAGIEMFVHGWYHRDVAAHSGVAAFKARHMTAGEGEFLGLSADEAARRMAEGRALIEDATGRPAAGFVAPAWLYGDGARAALAQSGFALAEDHFRVWQPASGRLLARGPVITWASRSRARRWSSLATARLARLGLRGQRVVRIASHPGDVGVPELLRSVERTLAGFAEYHVPGRYAELTSGPDIARR